MFHSKRQRCPAKRKTVDQAKFENYPCFGLKVNFILKQQLCLTLLQMVFNRLRFKSEIIIQNCRN